MKTNKMGHFVCGVLATYGLVVACGNSTSSDEEEGDTYFRMMETGGSDDKQSCLSKLYKKNTPNENDLEVVEEEGC